MASTKQAITIQSSATNTAGGTTTSASVDVTTSYGVFITARITNGSPGPTLPCTFSVEVSNDDSVWRNVGTFSADVTDSGVFDFPFVIEPTVMFIRTVFTGNTDESVTVEALGHELSTI